MLNSSLLLLMTVGPLHVYIPPLAKHAEATRVNWVLTDFYNWISGSEVDY